MERIAMGQEERDWLEWLKRAQDGLMTQRQAAEKMGVTDRWVRRLLARMADIGDQAVVHGLRGRASNRRISKEWHGKALALLKQPDWHDFGPTFASEQLAKRHQIEVSKETVRKWMAEAGLWENRSRKVQEVHCWRPRRSGYGELVQWDTSDHDWLGRKGRAGSLLGAVDRRCDQPELGAIRTARRNTGKHGGAMGVRGTERADGGCVYGPRRDVHGDATG